MRNYLSLAKNLLPHQSGDSTALSFALALETDHAVRLARYRKMWRFYNGEHWQSLQYTDEPGITMNYARMFTDLHVAMLFGGGFKSLVPDDPETAENEALEEREFVRARLDKTWQQNNITAWQVQAGQVGAVTGDLFLRVSWDVRNNYQEGGFAKVDIMPSQMVFPIFDKPVGQGMNRLKSVVIAFARYVGDQSDFLDSFRGASRGQIDLDLEIWTADTVTEWNSDGVFTRPNILGEIPVIHIPNLVQGHNKYGLSDIADIVDLNRELNEKSTDISDVINYQGSPTTIIKGARVGDLDRGPNNIWSIANEGATIENLSLGSDLAASLQYREELKETMHEIGMIPRDLVKALSGGDTSAVALAMKAFPLQQRLKLKKGLYSNGLQQVNRIILKLNALMDLEFREKFLALPRENRYRNLVVFNESLPRDESAELEKSGLRLEMGISSAHREMERHGMSKGEISLVKQQILEDRLQEIELMGKVESEQKNRSGNPDPKRPDPDSQGEAKSQNAENNLSG